MWPKLNRGNPTPNLHLIIAPIRKFLFFTRQQKKGNSLAFLRRRTDKDIGSDNTTIAVRQTEGGEKTKKKKRRKKKEKKKKEKARLAEGRINRPKH